MFKLRRRIYSGFGKKTEYTTKTNKEIQEKIKENLQKSYGENPLEKWEQNHERAVLTLKDPSIIIRVRPMLYNEDDKIEFKIQIKELLNLKLIRMSPHSSPAFMVRNHAEIKRGKARRRKTVHGLKGELLRYNPN